MLSEGFDPESTAAARRAARNPEETADGLLVFRTRAGSRWYRVHRAEHDPLWFGDATVGFRFNDPGPGATHPDAPGPYAGSAPDANGFGVWYAGATPEAAFAETFLRRPARRAVAASELAIRRLTTTTLARDLRLALLDGAGLGRAGVAAEVVHGPEGQYALSRVVARALWRHPAALDGIAYTARHDTGQFAAAVFDHARDAIVLRGTAALDAEPLLRALLTRYRFTLL